MALGQYVWPFFVNWLILFVACYVLVEFGQNYLYDQVTERPFLKVLGGSLLLALVLTAINSRFDTMFTSEIAYTVMQAIVWFVVFTLVFRFQGWHALAISLVAMVLLTGMATMANNTMFAVRGGTRPAARQARKPVRAPSGPPAVAPVTSPSPVTKAP